MKKNKSDKSSDPRRSFWMYVLLDCDWPVTYEMIYLIMGLLRICNPITNNEYMIYDMWVWRSKLSRLPMICNMYIPGFLTNANRGTSILMDSQQYDPCHYYQQSNIVDVTDMKICTCILINKACPVHPGPCLWPTSPGPRWSIIHDNNAYWCFVQRKVI